MTRPTHTQEALYSAQFSSHQFDTLFNTLRRCTVLYRHVPHTSLSRLGLCLCVYCMNSPKFAGSLYN